MFQESKVQVTISWTWAMQQHLHIISTTQMNHPHSWMAQ